MDDRERRWIGEHRSEIQVVPAAVASLGFRAELEHVTVDAEHTGGGQVVDDPDNLVRHLASKHGRGTVPFEPGPTPERVS